MAKSKHKRRRRNRRPETPAEMASYLKRTSAAGEQSIGTPTPERALKANGSMRLGQDRVFRVEDAPLQKLAARGALMPKDAALNRVLLEAGERYYKHWFLGRLDPCGAMDLTATSGRNAGSPLAPTAFASDNTMRHRQDYRAAQDALKSGEPQRFAYSVTNEIVLAEVPLEKATLIFFPHGHFVSNRAIVLDRLRGGLIRLAVHFGLTSARAFQSSQKLDSGAPGKHTFTYESDLRPATQK